MSTATLDRIIEEVKTLPTDERRQLLEQLERDERTAELRRIRRKYAHVKLSSDAFAAHKTDDIELEDRRRR